MRRNIRFDTNDNDGDDYDEKKLSAWFSSAFPYPQSLGKDGLFAVAVVLSYEQLRVHWAINYSWIRNR